MQSLKWTKMQQKKREKANCKTIIRPIYNLTEVEQKKKVSPKQGEGHTADPVAVVEGAEGRVDLGRKPEL